MISNPALLKTVLVVGGIYAIRLLARWRVATRRRSELTTPLVDPVLLETTFVAHDGDDVNLLAEVRDTLAHLNRQCYAEEFWNVDEQLSSLDSRLPQEARSTLRRAALRMLGTPSRWLQIVGTRTSARLGLPEALPDLRSLVETLDSKNPVDRRLRLIIDEAISELGDQ
ncbi:MAG: hypothetical protein ACLQVD_22100 [Capsulimonadaceae bacterium]